MMITSCTVAGSGLFRTRTDDHVPAPDPALVLAVDPVPATTSDRHAVTDPDPSPDLNPDPSLDPALSPTPDPSLDPGPSLRLRILLHEVASDLDPDPILARDPDPEHLKLNIKNRSIRVIQTTTRPKPMEMTTAKMIAEATTKF
jgi:hypothetical protein